MEATNIPSPSIQPDPDWVARLRERLLAHAFLFDDPRVYEAGVEDTLAEIEPLLRERS